MARPEELGDLLGRYLRDSGLAGFIVSEDLSVCWAQAVGEEMLAHTRVVGIRNQVLRVEVDGSPRLQELKSFMKAQLLEHLQENYKRGFIKDVSFSLGAF